MGETGIHSVQNGILLGSDIHEFFDKYMIAINLDASLIIVAGSPQFQTSDDKNDPEQL